MKRVFSTLLVLSLVALPMSAIAQDADGGGAPAAPTPTPTRDKLEGAKLDAALAEISRARKEVKSLKAGFTQERKITLLATSVKSKGELMCTTGDAATSRLRWDLAPPDDIIYFVGPEGLSYKTKTSSATIPAGGQNVMRALGDLRALLTGDLGSLRDRYDLGGSRSANDIEITGIAKEPTDPKAPKSAVRSFTLLLDKNLVSPISAKLIEGKASKDSIVLTFSNVVVNGPIDSALLKP